MYIYLTTIIDEDKLVMNVVLTLFSLSNTHYLIFIPTDVQQFWR